MKIMVRNGQRKSTIDLFTEEKAMTPTNIIARFKKTGIFPLDKHIFDKCDFLPSLVTDQTIDASTSIRHLGENGRFYNVGFQLQDLGSLNDVEIQNLETFQNNFLSQEQVIGYPKASRRKKDTREKEKVVAGLRTQSIFNRVRVRVHKKFSSPSSSSSSLNFNFSSSSSSSSSSSQNRVEKIQSE